MIIFFYFFIFIFIIYKTIVYNSIKIKKIIKIKK